MIIRILSDGQYDVPDDAVASLNEFDDQLEKAIQSGDEANFGSALGALLDRVRNVGTPVALDALTPSQLILPPEASTLHEVRDMLSGDGLIPG